MSVEFLGDMKMGRTAKTLGERLEFRIMLTG